MELVQIVLCNRLSTLRTGFCQYCKHSHLSFVISWYSKVEYMKETGLNRNEMYELLASTGGKIQYATDRLDPNLRLMVLLCNTLDRNLLLLQSMACSTACIYDTEGELLPVYEQINSDESDNYEDIDERDGLGATDSVSLADKAEDHLVPPNVSKCFAALSDLSMREANFLASESRDMFC
jgi:hypothetical protein